MRAGASGYVVLLLTLAAFAGRGADALLDKLGDGTLWETGVETLAAEPGFKWTSAKHETLRYALPEQKPPAVRLIDFGGIKVVEFLLNVKDGEADSAIVYLYSRGDSGTTEAAVFGSILRAAQAQCVNWWGTGRELPAKKLAGRKKIYSMEWNAGGRKALLSWSYDGSLSGRSDFQPEYIKLSVGVSEKGMVINTRTLKDYRDDYAKNVARSDDGDVYIDNIPMVDQGAKGYCVAATAERVVKYYGLFNDIDQHVFAQVANTTEAGTVLDDMVEAMKRMGGKLMLRVKEIYVYKQPRGIEDLRRLLRYYNRNATKKLELEKFEHGGVVNLTAIFASMEPDAWVRTRVQSEKNDYQKFKKQVKRHIDKGFPCVWSVVLGLVSEPGLPQARGGHQRLIIGYNEKTDTLIYSDSWGAGFEKRRMSFDNAWGISMSLMVYLPRSVKF